MRAVSESDKPDSPAAEEDRPALPTPSIKHSKVRLRRGVLGGGAVIGPYEPGRFSLILAKMTSGAGSTAPTKCERMRSMALLNLKVLTRRETNLLRVLV